MHMLWQRLVSLWKRYKKEKQEAKAKKKCQHEQKEIKRECKEETESSLKTRRKGCSKNSVTPTDSEEEVDKLRSYSEMTYPISTASKEEADKPRAICSQRKTSKRTHQPPSRYIVDSSNEDSEKTVMIVLVFHVVFVNLLVIIRKCAPIILLFYITHIKWVHNKWQKKRRNAYDSKVMCGKSQYTCVT